MNAKDKHRPAVQALSSIPPDPKTGKTEACELPGHNHYTVSGNCYDDHRNQQAAR